MLAMVGGAFSLLLGIVGFTIANPEGSFLDHFYLAIQLFPLQSGAVYAKNPWELEVARLLAPAALGYTAVLAVLALVQGRFQAVRLLRIRDHAVICGLGHRGTQLARDFRRKGIEVVVVEQDDDCLNLSEAKNLGCMALIGSAVDPLMLQKARVSTARYFVAVTGKDDANVESAVRGCEVVQRSPEGLQCLTRAFIHVGDRQLRPLLKEQRLFSSTPEAFEINVFSVFDTTARWVLDRHPLEVDLQGRVADSVHLVIAGFSQFGECLALQAARIGHYASGRRLRITVIDREADARRVAFRQRYPQFELVADLEFVVGDVWDAEFLRARTFGKDAGGGAMNTVAVCLDDDSASFSCALNLLPKIEGERARILIHMARNSGISVLLNGHNTQLANRPIFAFGMLEDVCTWETVVHAELDRMARAIHENYLARRKSEGLEEGSDPSLVPWQRLDEHLRDSNRLQADHIPVKLRALGMTRRRAAGEKVANAEFAAGQVEKLAGVEHARWCADRYLAGWKHGPQKNVEQRVSPFLVSWEKLDEKTRDKDREAVRNIPRLLAEQGWEVVTPCSKP
jgi:voltage-gated potassium channel Kch